MPTMDLFSFIDFGLQDFLRNEDDEVIKISCNDVYQAEEWLLKNGAEYGWTNQGVRYWNWDEEA